MAGGSRSRYFALDPRGRLIGYSDKTAAWADTAALQPPEHPRDPESTTAQATINALMQPPPVGGSAFSYDLVGNRLLTAEPGSTSFSSLPDADNRYVSVADKSWEYDIEGRLLYDGSQLFRYTADGFVGEEFKDEGGVISRSVGFIRDALGRVLACIDSSSVEYVKYADRVPITQSTAGGDIELTPGRFADEPLHIAGQGRDVWIVQDGLRSPRLLVRRGPLASNEILSFRPFGAAEASNSSAEVFAFAGMLRFPGSSLLHSMMRSYQPDIGRYMQQDPAGFVDGTNRYSYASNNPVDLFDPLGLQSLTPSDERILGYLESVAAALKLDDTHSGLSASAAGSNKHLECQFCTGFAPPTSGLTADEAMRIAPEIHIDENGKILAVDVTPDKAPKNSRTVDIAIVKKDLPGGRNSIVGQKAEDVLDFVIDYKTGNAQLDKRKELEALIGYKPVVKLTGKAGELSKALTQRFAHLALVKAAKESALKKAAKWGLKRIPKALPVLGALFTYSTAEGSQGERIARTAAGEVGVGPVDLELLWDAWEAGAGSREALKEWYVGGGMTFGIGPHQFR